MISSSGVPCHPHHPELSVLNGVAGIVGGIGGGILGGGIELIKQLWSKDESISLSKIAGATVQGAITCAVAGITLGASFAVTATAAASANVIGGTVDRTIRGEDTTATDVAIDATVGAAAAGVGRLGGGAVKNYVN